MRTVATLLLLSSVLLGQRTWVVYCSAGPGVDFTDLAPAVAAASAGDTILLVWDTSCGTFHYGGAVIDKAISVVGVSAGAQVSGLLEIRGIPAGERVLLSNIDIAPPSQYLSTPHGVDVHDCDGDIHLEDIWCHSLGLVNGVVHFVDCANITMHWCELRAPGSPVWVTPNHSQPAPECSVLFRRTTATLVECGLSSAYPIPNWTGTMAEPADAVWLENSNVTLVDTDIWGADRNQQGSLLLWPERRAVVQDGGSLTIGPGTQLYGGYYPDVLNIWVPSAAIWSLNNGTIVQDPLTYDSGCACPNLQSRVVPAVMMERAFRNRSYRVQVRGQVGDFALLGVGGYSAPGVAMPYGQLLLDPTWLMIVGCAQIPALGAFDFTFQMHPAVPMDLLLGFQAGLIHGNGSIELSLPAAFSVLWEPGRTWP